MRSVDGIEMENNINVMIIIVVTYWGKILFQYGKQGISKQADDDDWSTFLFSRTFTNEELYNNNLFRYI